MLYKVIPEEKVVCVWSEDAPRDEIASYRQKGYRVAYFLPGNTVRIVSGMDNAFATAGAE